VFSSTFGNATFETFCTKKTDQPKPTTDPPETAYILYYSNNEECPNKFWNRHYFQNPSKVYHLFFRKWGISNL